MLFEDAGLCCTGLASRPLPFSALYITATFVDGEFMVPVSDQPIATFVSILEYNRLERHNTLAVA